MQPTPKGWFHPPYGIPGKERPRVDNEIIVVSGLPRSGTSLMMQMLDKGGIPVVTDHVRTADADNPRGYYELERVKAIKRDASWLPELEGKAVKIISQLLYELPSNHKYRVIFMERDLDEVVPSQERMLVRAGQGRGARPGDQAAVHPAPRPAPRVARPTAIYRRPLRPIRRRRRTAGGASGSRRRFPRGQSRSGAHGGGGRRIAVPESECHGLTR